MFKLAFETKNPEFDNDRVLTCAQILDDISQQMTHGTTEGPIVDMNGNTIGRFSLTPDQE